MEGIKIINRILFKTSVLTEK